MQRLARYVAVLAFASAAATYSAVASADDYSDTIALFKGSSQSAAFFNNSYGYAVFPTVGEGGFIVGGAYGKGKVYVRGAPVGDTSITELSVGAQGGGQAYSEIIFFKDQAAFNRFRKGNFAFGADAAAVAITASAEASAGTTGATAGAQTNKRNAQNMAAYRNGMLVFTIVKGGAMLQAAVSGQKFSTPPTARGAGARPAPKARLSAGLRPQRARPGDRCASATARRPRAGTAGSRRTGPRSTRRPAA